MSDSSGGFGFKMRFHGSMPKERSRQERKSHIEKFKPLLRRNQMPELSKDECRELLSDLKEEGNALFKAAEYDSAAEHYTCALNLGNMLTFKSIPLESKFLSSLYTNRAACCNKTQMYDSAIADCDFGIAADRTNIKGYYRKAQALMWSKRGTEALQTARLGKNIALSINKPADCPIFDELIIDIQNSTGSYDPYSGAPPKTAKTQKTETKKQDTKTETKTQPAKTQPSTKPANGTKATVSVKEAGKAAAKNGADLSWLEGTNAKKDMKKNQNQKGKKKTKKKLRVKQVTKTNYSGQFESLANNNESSDSSNIDSSSELEAGRQMPKQSPEPEPAVPVASPIKDTEEEKVDNEKLSWAEQCPETPLVATQNINMPKSVPQKHAPTFDNYGLDDFGLPANARPPSSNAKSSASASTSRASSTSTQVQPKKPISVPAQKPLEKTVQAQKKSPLKYDFASLTPPTPLPAPFSTVYDYSLACDQCFSYTGSGGPAGYTPNPKLSHKCSRYVLLVRRKGCFDEPWAKVRPRPPSNFQGKYRMCTQFEKGNSCQVGEMRCSFGHGEIEVHLWNLDRQGIISIEDFIEIQRKFVFEGKMKKDWGSNVIEPRDTPSPQSVPTPTPTTTTTSAPAPLAPWAHTMPPVNTSRPPPTSFVPPVQAPRSVNQAVNLTNNTNTVTSAASQGRVPVYAATNQRPSPPRATPQAPPPQAPPTARPPAPPAQQVMQQFAFPLAETHTFKLVCANCVRSDPAHHGAIVINPPPGHVCDQNVLAVQRLAAPRTFVRIRERLNHRAFPGKYALCRNYCRDPPLPCNRPAGLCSFAHSIEEQRIWGLEKDGQFSVKEFITQNRDAGTEFGIRQLLQDYGGSFHFLCHYCFFSQPARIAVQSTTRPDLCTGHHPHPWERSKQLVHVKINGPQMQVEPISQRPFQHLGPKAFFNMCAEQRFCHQRRSGTCRYAHSMIERDLWIVQRDTGISHEEIIAESKRFEVDQRQAQQQAQQQPQAQAPPPQQSPSPTKTPELPKLPYRVITVCAQCYKLGIKSTRDPKRDDRCTNAKNNGHMWSINKMYLMRTANGTLKELRSLPDTLPKYANFIVCAHVRQRGKCNFMGTRRCQFAHSEEERVMWTFMYTNKVHELEKLEEMSELQLAASVKKPIAKGQSVVEAAPAPWKPAQGPAVVPFELLQNGLYCQYCSVQCNSQKQWDEHCAADRHMMNVNSDKDHQWNHRQPPWGVANGQYKLCARHEGGQQCPYSHVPELYNMCRYAHGQAELDEWVERWEWRQLKRDMARKNQVFSYMEALLDDFEGSETPMDVITDELDGVKISCDKDLTLFDSNKKAELEWTFTVKSGRELEKVSLLYNKDRLHFTLANPCHPNSPSQIAPGAMFKNGDSTTYNIKVKFVGGLFGSFMQWLVLDFGSRPVVVQKLNVELGTPAGQTQVQKLRQTLAFDRWTEENRVITKFSTSSTEGDDFNDKLLKKYRSPASAQQVVTLESIATALNKHNYRHKMHSLLHLEEFTRHRIISSYNLVADAELMTSVVNEGQSGMIFTRQGELFARVPLGEQLTEDTNAGKLILSSVRSVLIAPQHSSTSKVYEAEIVSKENFDYEGRGRDYVYLCLSQRCVLELELQAGESVAVEIQFVMNRLAFCQMHHAIDQLEDPALVFPDCTKILPQFTEMHDLNVTSSILNAEQMKVVRHIVAERVGTSAPLVVYGPFGTGKTETLAQASMVLLREKPDARILICTQSNSAADLYITKHFATLAKQPGPGRAGLEILRVMYSGRRINTVSQAVKKFCLLSPDGSAFVHPRREHILTKQVVLTTLNMSLLLSELNIAGYFSHIFVDEGGQALEAEAVMPLTLATPSTCVVVAGDYNQMGPKIYSAEARRQHMDRSLLQRLYDHNQVHHVGLLTRPSPGPPGSSPHASPLNVLLRHNYRSKMEIVRFLSAIFYEGPNTLVAAARDLPDVDGIIPLMFYAAQGREVLDEHATSYYNPAEVEEVVSVVEGLWARWPVAEWGARAADAIAVVTPYAQHVQHIRTALRRKSRDLAKVTVERVMNVPGKEFRAVVVTTVRTRYMIDNPQGAAAASRLDTSECDGDGADFGFLSDLKLINTALTRAQSLVAVVGDPVALCSVGSCVTLWRSYLKHCSNLGSIVPSSVTLDSVRKQVNNISLSQQGGNLYELNRLAAGDDTNIQAVAGPARSLPASPPLQVVDMAAQGGVVDEAMVEIHREPMAEVRILQELKNEVNQKHQGPVKMIRKSGVVALTSEEAGAGADANSDDEDSVDTKHNVLITDQQQLMALVNSDRFVLATLYRDITLGMCARPVEKDSKFARVVIGSWSNCRGAMVDDEAVVEILDEKIEVEDDDEIPIGKIMGISKHARGKSYVTACQPSQSNPGLMLPLDENLPPIYIVTPSQHVDKMTRGHVVVYETKPSGQIVPRHYEPVEGADSKVFIVRFLQYDQALSCNIGIVIGVLPPGEDKESAMKIVDTCGGMKPEFSAETVAEVKEKFPEGYRFELLPEDRRLVYNDKSTFTISSKETGDVLQNAFSVELRKDGMYIIGVHLSDVEHFVKQGDKVDLEAQTRSSTLPRPARDMLPERLGRDLCAFLPGQDRLALSLFFTIDATCNIKEVRPLKSLIRSCRDIKTSEAELVLSARVPEDLPQELAIAVKLLYDIACNWRLGRLGNAATAEVTQEIECEAEGESGTPKAKLLVDEVLLMVNHNIAQFFMMQNIGRVFSRQVRPSDVAIEKWKQEVSVAGVPDLFPALLWPFTPQGHTCTCQEACQCAPATTPAAAMTLSAPEWRRMVELAQAGNPSKVQEVVVDSAVHPGSAVARATLEGIVSREEYLAVTDNTKPELWYHCGARVDEFTHVTAPLTCYMDLVLHRILVYLIEKQYYHIPGEVYSADQLHRLVTAIPQVHLQAELHDKQKRLLRHLDWIDMECLVLYPVVESAYPDGVRLLFQPSCNVPQLTLPLAEIGSWSGSEFTVTLSLYDNENPTLAAHPEMRFSEKPYQLQLHREEWRLIQNSVRSFQPQHLCELVLYFEQNSQTLQHSKELAAQSEILMVPQHSDEASISRITTVLDPCTVVKVQVGFEYDGGIMRPAVQLLYLTPSLALCLEHSRETVACFSPTISPLTPAPSLKPTYRDTDSYRSAWGQVVEAESITRAVRSGHALRKIVHNVTMALRGSGDYQKTSLTLRLNAAIYNKLGGCQGRHSKALVCLQYPFSSDTWIGHGVVTATTQAGGGEVELTGSIEDQTHNLCRDVDEAVTMHFMPVDAKYGCMEESLTELDNASELTKSLALGRNPPALAPSYLRHAKEVTCSPMAGLMDGNQTQELAVEKALSNSFMIIKGAPGTGKTAALVKIIVQMVQLNKRVSVGEKKKPQVLVVAPTEQCLDKIIGMLSELPTPSCPRLTRVYGPHQQPQAPVSGPSVSVVFASHQRLLSVPGPLQQAEVVLAATPTTALAHVMHCLNVAQVLVDSAEAVSEPELLMSLVSPCSRGSLLQVVLAGDVHQAPGGLNRSLLHRYADQGVTLTTHYRMHSSLASFPWCEFYGGAAMTCGRGEEQSKPSALKLWPGSRDRPMVFVDCAADGGAEHGALEDTLCNAHEASIAARLASHLVLRSHVRQSDVAVVSLFPAQAQLIGDILADKNMASITTVPAADTRGCEWDYVVLSTVRVQPVSSVEHHPSSEWKEKRLGLAADSGLVNLALTRARKGLIILGCSHLLKADPVWRKLLRHYNQHQKVVPASEFAK